MLGVLETGLFGDRARLQRSFPISTEEIRVTLSVDG